MSRRSGLADALAALGRVLSSRGVGWYVFGAQAASAYGSPRLTADIDVTAAIPVDDAAQFASDAGDEGFSVRVPDLDGFVARTRVIPLTHDATGVPVDVVIAGPGLEHEFLTRIREVDLEGVAVPLIAPEDLIVTKILAGRPKDTEDVQAILRERVDELDVDLICGTLSQLDEALARGDLRPTFESVLRGIRTDPG